MNTKTILGISLAAAFAVSLMMSQSAIAGGGDYKSITGYEVTKNNPAKTVDITISTEGSIPDSSDTMKPFGYAFITGTNDDGLPENVLVATTHLCVSDSLQQGNVSSSICSEPVAGLLEALGFGDGANEAHDGEEWHPHVLDLKPTTSECATAITNAGATDLGLEVDLQRTLQTQNNVSPSYSAVASDSDIEFSDVPRKDIKSSAFGKAGTVFFGIVGIADGDTITNLCLTTGSDI